MTPTTQTQTQTQRPCPTLQKRSHDSPAQLLTWHCPDCGRLGSFFAPLPVTNLDAVLAAQADHAARGGCGGWARLQSIPVNHREAR